METSLQKIIAAIVGIMIMFIIPVYIAFEKVDDVSYSLAVKLTQNFVDNVRNKGYISPDMYSDFVSGLYATNNTYDVEIEHVKKRYDPAIYIYDYQNGSKGKLLHILDYDKYTDENGKLPSEITIDVGIYNLTNSNIEVEDPSITMADGTEINFTNGGENSVTPRELYELKIEEYKRLGKIVLDKGEVYADVDRVTGNDFDEQIYRPANIDIEPGTITLNRTQGNEPDTLDYNTYIQRYDNAITNNESVLKGQTYTNGREYQIEHVRGSMRIIGVETTDAEEYRMYDNYIDAYRATRTSGSLSINGQRYHKREIYVTEAHIHIKDIASGEEIIDIYQKDAPQLYDLYVEQYQSDRAITLQYNIDTINVDRKKIVIEKLERIGNAYSVYDIQEINDNTDLNSDGIFEYTEFKNEFDEKGTITLEEPIQYTETELKIVDPSVTIKDPDTNGIIKKYESAYEALTYEERAYIYTQYEENAQVVDETITYKHAENCWIESAHVINEEHITDKQIVAKLFKDTGVSKVEFLRQCMLGNGNMYDSLVYMNENSYIMNEGDTINVIVKNKNQTVASIFYSMFTANVGTDEIAKIYVDYGGTIKNDGNTTVTLSSGLINNESGRLFKYKGQAEDVILAPGKYQIECWGAAGGGYETGSTSTTGGKGAYAKGIFNITKETTLYVYVGGKGTKYSNENRNNGGYNGGGNSYNGYGGGGATDVRLLKGDYNDTASLLTRVIVAAGGGGSSKLSPSGYYGNGGPGGNILSEGIVHGGNGYPLTSAYAGIGAKANTISVGHENYTNDSATVPIPETEKGGLGQGGSVDFDGAGAGGGGYYGGSASHDQYAGGGGGLSYVYSNNTLSFDEYENKIKNRVKPFINDENKWDGIEVLSTAIINGTQDMDNPIEYIGLDTIKGNHSNGYVIIKKID